tara:strand:+ start:340 stop:564 length:225 start_codon:yes stop_codon:yes gene_type:complete
MKEWLFIISILISLFVGVKFKSKCCGRDCEISIEKEDIENTNETLRSITIGRVSKKPKKIIKQQTESESNLQED